MSHNTAIFAAACLSLSLITAPALADDSSNKVLTVYTYDSFVSDWGMGPLIKPRRRDAVWFGEGIQSRRDRGTAANTSRGGGA